ncbi:UNVERIFIED_CONTAM: zinc finger protein [Trichonephila clavipes]
MCNKEFYSASNLKTHILIHTKEKPYKKPYVYELCDKLFSHNGCLKIRLQVHTKEKPYHIDNLRKSHSI